MLYTTQLERIFVFVDGDKETNLSDPDSTWSPKNVLNFYAPTYPILTTATIEGPEIKDDKIYYKFESVIGTKG
jgi:PRTRC genetic system protein C